MRLRLQLMVATAYLVISVSTAPSEYLHKVSTYGQPGCIPLTVDQVVKNWETLWSGNFNLLNETVMPNVQVYQDRLPIGNTTAFVPVQNSSDLLAFMERGRIGYDEYRFVEDFYFANHNGSMITGRWHLEAIVGNSTSFPRRKPGDRVSYNGTDIIFLDQCSGRIQQVLTAQDLIDFYHQLGRQIPR